MSEIIEALFDTILSADSIPAQEIYKGMTDYSGYSDRLDSFCKKHGFDIEQENAVDDIAADLAYKSEMHGFKQGLKLGFKLAEEIYADKGGNTTP